MKKTFETEDFDAAIKDKDYIKIKNYVINSIRNNPGFKYSKKEGDCSEAMAAFRKLLESKDDLPGLFSSYQLQNGEEEFNENNKELWTQEYFIRQTFLLGENFCKERFLNIKKIGKYLAKTNFCKPQEEKDIDKNQEEKSMPISFNTNKKINYLTIVLGGISIIILLVGKIVDIKNLFNVGVVMLVITSFLTICRIGRRE